MTYLILSERYEKNNVFLRAELVRLDVTHTHPVRIVYVVVVVQTITKLIYQSLKNDSESKQLV